MVQSVDSVKLKKLVSFFKMLPHVSIPNAMKLAKYSDDKVSNRTLQRFLWHALPGGFNQYVQGNPCW
jgi:hypothetical protein